MSRVRIDIITIFPDYFTPLSVSLLGKATSRGDIELQVHDLRTWAHGVHRAVDDAPFGGGAGMVLRPEPVFAAVEAVDPPRPLLLLGPGGRRFDQKFARSLADRYLVLSRGEVVKRGSGCDLEADGVRGLLMT